MTPSDAVVPMFFSIPSIPTINKHAPPMLGTFELRCCGLPDHLRLVCSEGDALQELLPLLFVYEAQQ